MKRILSLFAFILLAISVSAQSRFYAGLFTSNLQMPLNDDFYDNPASFSHPLRPSIIGLDISLYFTKHKVKHGFTVQYLAGGYWFSETKTYTRYQGVTTFTADRYTSVAGAAFGYSFRIPLFTKLGKQKDSTSGSWFNQLELFSQTFADIYHLKAQAVAAPYDRMYALEFREFNDGRMSFRQTLALQLANTQVKHPYAIFAGPEYNLYLDGMRGRWGYRFGMSMFLF